MIPKRLLLEEIKERAIIVDELMHTEDDIESLEFHEGYLAALEWMLLGEEDEENCICDECRPEVYFCEEVAR